MAGALIYILLLALMALAFRLADLHPLPFFGALTAIFAAIAAVGGWRDAHDRPLPVRMKSALRGIGVVLLCLGGLSVVGVVTGLLGVGSECSRLALHRC